MDVALGRPRDALHWLEFAYRSLPREVEVAGSYAHALARSGKRNEARRVLKRALRRGDAAVDALLDDWLSLDPPGSNRRAVAVTQQRATLGDRPRIFAPRY
jgi:uncharacterized protein HemY